MENLKKICISNSAISKRYNAISEADADYKRMYNLEYEELRELIGLCNDFDKHVENDVKSIVRMGYCLRKIRDEKLYEHAKSKGIYDFAKKFCGLSRSMCGEMLLVAEKFYVEKFDKVGYKVSGRPDTCESKNIDEESIFDYRDMSAFSFYKLYEIQSLPYELITKYVNDETVTVSQLHSLVASLRTDSVAEKTEAERERELMEETNNIEKTYNPKQFYNLEYFKRKTKEQLIGFIMSLQRAYIKDDDEKLKG